jgi:hypothetical protein
MAQVTLVGQIILIIEASRLHSDTSQSVGLLWTTDQLDAETSTMTTYNTKDRHPCPQRDSSPQSQPVSGRRATPETARPLGWVNSNCILKTPRNLRKCNYCFHNVFRHHILKNVNLSAFDNKTVSKTY